jgi:glycosyltransferase involved in cell wall biosynthesis
LTPVPATRSHIHDEGARTGAEDALEVTIVAHDIGAVGGMERQLEELLLDLRRRGHHVTVIARTCRLPPDSGVSFRRVRAPRRPFVLAYPWFMVAGSLALGRHRRGVVQATGSIVVNRVDVVAIHYLHRVGPANASRANILYRAQVRAASVLKRLGERMCLRPGRVRSVVCVSEGVAEEVRRHFPRIAGLVESIHNGVDTDAFAPGVRAAEALALRAQLGLAADQLVAAFVGSEWGRKGLEPAIRALADAPAWALVVAGGGEESRYRALAAELGLDERIRWMGVTSDVQLVYGLADCFVLPSAYETFSLVTFEAAASGLPILATGVSGVRELIEDGRNGFSITRDPAQIAQRLNELAADPDLRRRLGSAARESALEYSWGRMVDRHVDLYRRLAAGARR